MTRAGESYTDWQQKRGMLADAVDWAITEYDEYMKDDHYDAQGKLNQIIGRLRIVRSFAVDPHEQARLEGIAQERRAVVALLREPASLWSEIWAACEDYFVADDVSERGIKIAMRALADAIERGEHWKGVEG